MWNGSRMGLGAFLLKIYLLCAILLTGCGAAVPLRIGFIAELSGRNASFGVQGRNGAQLAVDEINRSGGVRGQQIELVVRDNQANPEQLLAANQELIDSGVFVLTGHLTSWETLEAKPLAESRDVILFSPSTSTPILSGKKDNFFRLIPASNDQAYPLAEYAYHQLGARKVAILADEDNAAFTYTYAEAFLSRFVALGGEKVSELHFSSKSKPDFRPLITQMRIQQPDLLLLVTSAVDTALIAQQVRLFRWPVTMASSQWVYTDALIQNGGEAVEGMIVSSHHFNDCLEPNYRAFQQAYTEAYLQEPAFVAALAYETIYLLERALETTGNRRQGLNEALASIDNFQGLCGKVVLDEFGDAHRSTYLLTIRGGSFEVLQTISYEAAP